MNCTVSPGDRGFHGWLGFEIFQGNKISGISRKGGFCKISRDLNFADIWKTAKIKSREN